MKTIEVKIHFNKPNNMWHLILKDCKNGMVPFTLTQEFTNFFLILDQLKLVDRNAYIMGYYCEDRSTRDIWFRKHSG